MNSDCNLSDADYPLPGNDASARSIYFFVSEIVSAYLDGKSGKK
jgi:ribosomal protein S2